MNAGAGISSASGETHRPNEWRRKFGLGSVQLGLPYGIKNPAGKIARNEAASILSLALRSGVELIDTAAAYGDAEDVLGSLGKMVNFQVVTKVHPNARTPPDVEASVNSSLRALRLTRVHGVLVHDTIGFFKDRGNWSSLLRMRQCGVIGKIGVSVYRPAELESLLDQGFEIELVQVPFSVLDTRFRPLLPRLKKAGIEVHARSLFLQGLYFMDVDRMPPHFSSISDAIIKIRGIARRLDVSLPALLLTYGALEPRVDRIVVGVDSAANLIENLCSLENAEACAAGMRELRSMGLTDESVLLPMNWPKGGA